MNISTEDYGILRFANIYLTRLTAKLFHYFQTLIPVNTLALILGAKCKRTCVRAPARCIKLFIQDHVLYWRGIVYVCV